MEVDISKGRAATATLPYLIVDYEGGMTNC
jgi:hypothetical protein